MKKSQLLTLFLLITFNAATAQNDSIVKQTISKVQQNHETYFRGDATNVTAEQAQFLATQMLHQEIAAYLDTAVNTSVDTSAVNVRLVRLAMRRGDHFRSFVFVKKSDVVAVTAPAISEPTQPTTHPLSDSLTTDTSTLLNQLLTIGTLTELHPFLILQKEKGTVLDYNRYSALEDASLYHIVIYTHDRQIVALLSPGREQRVNLRTALPASPEQYKGCGAIAVLLSQNHN